MGGSRVVVARIVATELELVFGKDIKIGGVGSGFSRSSAPTAFGEWSGGFGNESIIE